MEAKTLHRHEQVLAYFKDYTAQFNLQRLITFNSEVLRVEQENYSGGISYTIVAKTAPWL